MVEIKPEKGQIKDISSKLLTLSSEGEPVFSDRISEIVEKSLMENRPITFTSITCRVSKLTTSALRRIWTPDIIWAKERNDQPVEITQEAAEENGLPLINPKMALIFSEFPQIIKQISSLGVPWEFLLVIADDPQVDVRRGLARKFKDFSRVVRAFEIMCLFHREAIKKLFHLGLKNTDQEHLLTGKVMIKSFSEIDRISFPGLGEGQFIDICAKIASKLKGTDHSGLPEGILDEFEAANSFWRERNPAEPEDERRNTILEHLIPSKVLAGKWLAEKAANSAGSIILSSIRPQPLDKTQSLLSPSNIPVLFPFRNFEGNFRLNEINPAGSIIPAEATWFHLGAALTLEWVKWLRTELEQMSEQDRQIAEFFIPVFLGERGNHE